MFGDDDDFSRGIDWDHSRAPKIGLKSILSKKLKNCVKTSLKLFKNIKIPMSHTYETMGVPLFSQGAQSSRE